MTDFTEPTTRALRALVDLVIPPSREYGIPGAGDEAIFAEILEAASSARGFVEAAMTALDEAEADDEPTLELNDEAVTERRCVRWAPADAIELK